MPQTYNDERTVNRSELQLRGRFFLNGAGAIDNTQNVGRLITATRTGVGTLTLKFNVVAKQILFVKAEMSKVAILNRLFHLLGVAQGTDGMWTATYALTDLNNAGVVAAEFAAANAAAFVTYEAVLETTNP